MSCYFRHLKETFAEAGIEITPANKRDVDRAIHKLVGVPYKDCPATWKALKAGFLASDKGRRDLIKQLKKAAK